MKIDKKIFSLGLTSTLLPIVGFSVFAVSYQYLIMKHPFLGTVSANLCLTCFLAGITLGIISLIMSFSATAKLEENTKLLKWGRALSITGIVLPVTFFISGVALVYNAMRSCYANTFPY